jgi:hypothetical protein
MSENGGSILFENQQLSMENHSISLNHGFHFTGGEPFLNYDILDCPLPPLKNHLDFVFIA